MRLQRCTINLSDIKKSNTPKLLSTALMGIVLFSLLSACTPYNGSVHTNNGNLNRPYNPQVANTPSNSGPNYVSNNPTSSQSNSGNQSTIVAYYPDTSVSNSNATATYYPEASNSNLNTNTGYTNSPPSHGFNVDQGVNALLSCTAELGYNRAFTTNDYQNCLQMTQATLTDYAFDILGQYIMSWADFAIDTALSALGISIGRSYASPQQKSAQLTSVIATGYRWY